MKKVAVLYIATGKYVRLWPGFLESAEKYLLKSCEVEYFVFTDVDHLAEEEDNPRIHRIFQEPMPWPYTTLLRFEIFLKAEEQLKAFDYIYFFNANCEFKQPITEEMLLPRPKKHEHMVFVLHPAFYWRYNYEFTYDHNPRCKAYIPMGLGRDYVCGGINGGDRDVYKRQIWVRRSACAAAWRCINPTSSSRWGCTCCCFCNVHCKVQSGGTGCVRGCAL